MSEHRLLKVLGHTKLEMITKYKYPENTTETKVFSMTLVNSSRNINKAISKYGSEESWAEHVLDEMQKLSNENEVNITLSKGFLKKLESLEISTNIIQNGRYVKPVIYTKQTTPLQDYKSFNFITDEPYEPEYIYDVNISDLLNILL